MYSFDDVETLRKQIFDAAKEAASSIKPISQKDFTLSIEDVDYTPIDYTEEDFKKALLEHETLGWPLKGTVKFKFPGGEITKRTTLAVVPYLTSRGSFVVDGAEYLVWHQQRLRPGIYVFNRLSGEPTAHINVGQGRAHRYLFDPQSKIFYLQIGQANIPLYPILKRLGISDDVLEKIWGKEILVENQKKDSEEVINRFYRSFNVPNDVDLSQYFSTFTFDRNVILRNLNIDSDRLTNDVILATTKKMLDIFKGEAETDDRDALVNQSVWTVADLLRESISRSSPILRGLLWKLMRNPTKESIPANLLSPRVLFLVRELGLSGLPDGANPLETLDNLFHISRMGEGSITNVDAIPSSARDVHPTHFGYIDPTTTPESLKIGVDSRISISAKYYNGELYAPFINVKTLKEEYLNPNQVYNSYIVFPHELEQNKRFVFGFYRGKEAIFPREKAQYILKDVTSMFGPLSNLIPFKSVTFPHRIAMGSRMLVQALPLIDREAPLVQSVNENGIPFVKLFSKFVGAVYSNDDGVVQAVDKNKIVIRTTDGKDKVIHLSVNMPYDKMTGVTQQPVVNPGQKVSKGQLLAVSNYTDKDGNLALGINARVAYISSGRVYEDAILVSESFAKRLNSDHLFTYSFDNTQEGVVAGKNKFVAIFPGRYTKEILDNYSENGLIKPGTRVTKDMPLVLAVREIPASTVGRRKLFSDASIKWEWDVDGEVVEAVPHLFGYTIVVKTNLPAIQGDKLSGLYGNKGVITILPDKAMPRDEEGNPVDIVMSPLSLISRGNVGQIYEALLGKAAKKLGQPILVKDFSNAGNCYQFVKDILEKAGVKPTDRLYLPDQDKWIEALTGYAYFLKLHHLAEDKLQGVGIAEEYSSEEIPIGGKEGSAKRMGLLDLNALLSHGAYNVITDASLFRGQRDEDLWRVFLAGYSLPRPKVPQIWNKFVNLLRAAGINPIIGPRSVKLFAMTKGDIDALAGNRNLENSETVKFKEDRFIPISGGLFDERLTGGLSGNVWSAVKLPVVMPNPVMVDVLATLLDLGTNEFEAILYGGKEYKTEYGSGKGPDFLYKLISNLDIDREIEKIENVLPSASPSKASKLIKKLSYLIGMKNFGVKPADLFWDRFPVIPPIFRPIFALSSGVLIVNDLNYLYKELIESVNTINELKEISGVGPEEIKSLWTIMKAIAGLDEISTKQKQELRGVLRLVVGKNPKEGIVHRRLLGAETFLVGRGVVVPNPHIDMDHIGIPRSIAYSIYKPFILRELIRKGVRLTEALRMVREKHPIIEGILDKVVSERPVIVNRAPVWHKYGIMAFKPILTNGKAVEVCPLVTAGFGMDFDGDQVQFHVPVSDEAVKEAYERLLPSKNLFSAANLRTLMPVPSQEFIMALWKTTGKDERLPKRVFTSEDDALKAYMRGEITIDQPIILVK